MNILQHEIKVSSIYTLFVLFTLQTGYSQVECL